MMIEKIPIKNPETEKKIIDPKFIQTVDLVDESMHANKPVIFNL